MSQRKLGWGGLFVCGLVSLIANGLSAADGPAGGQANDSQRLAFFEKRIRPLLIEKCYECHAASTEASGGLLLDTRAGWQRGGDSGPAIVPGNPEASRLMKAIGYSDSEMQMPPDGPLDAADVAAIGRWIADGAFDPRAGGSTVAAKSSGLPLERAREHWAYRPVEAQTVPAIQQDDDRRNVIDAFIHQRLVEADIPLAAPANRRELLRRLSFDLHGLPPSAESLQSFEEDSAPDAIERRIDRMLASPKFGERMARHWMDVARYAESLTLRGFILPQAWRYRDYLIASFAQDRPFDAMVREQIAGDLLSDDDWQQRQQQLIATTFLALGNTNLEEQDKTQLEMDYIDEQLEVIGRVFMGQTIGCARCHDHKFDPIPTSDYYALAGIFRASRAMDHENVSKWIERPLPVEPEQERRLTRLEAVLEETIAEEKRVEKQLGKQTAPKSDVVIDPAKLPGIVVDDSASMKVGSWKESTSVRPYVGAGYVTDNNDRGQIKTMTFQPDRVPEGVMQVRLAYTPGRNRSSHVLVRVFSADGETSITVDQQTPPPIDQVWFPLGEFRFEKDGQAFVLVSNEGSNGHVIADAVQFLPVGPGSPTAPAPVAKSDSPTESAATKKEKRLAVELKELKARRQELELQLAARPRSLTIVESLPAHDIPIHIRGSVHNLGATVPRGFLRCADFETRPPFSDQTSGRREFASWLSDPRHPLTARVFVNRLWLWSFGGGLVRTVDNFGTTGEAPLQPELLDFLAKDFMDHDWSPQMALRRMLLSASYQRSCQADQRAVELDPDNRLFGRANRKRLDVESLRDAMLAISGELTSAPGGSTLRPGTRDDYRYQHAPALRAVYQPILRNSLPELYDAFDFPNPSIPSGERSQSVVAPQALAMLNSPWVQQRALHAADEIVHQADDAAGSEPPTWKALIVLAFERALGREPTTIESYSAESLVADLEREQLDRNQVVARLIHGLFASIDFRYLD